MENGEEMAFCREVMARNIRRGLFIAVFAFILGSAVSAAPPSPPVSHAADWRTGEIEVNYSGVMPGNTVKVYARQYDQPYAVVGSFVATESSGRYIVKYEFENGQTVWYRISQVSAETHEESALSVEQKITPPITAFIINWPDMLIDINDMINSALERIWTPSQGAIDDLTDAINDLKNSVGAGAAGSAGGQIISGIDGMQSGMRPPIVTDDGNGTFTGGANPNTPPYSPGTSNDNNPSGGGSDISLEHQDPDSGTMGEMGIRIPYGVDFEGELLYFRIFTEEQMEKMKWYGLLYKIAEATMWIFASIALVVRFIPQFKV